MTAGRTAVLVLNHVLDRHLIEHYRSLTDDLNGLGDVYLLSDRTQPSVTFSRLPGEAREFRFTVEDLLSLGYPGRCGTVARRTGARNLALGNADLPVLLFASAHPRYDYLWCIEYDVRFSGNWRSFVSAFDDSDADLLGSSFTRRQQTPDWTHWSSLSIPDLDCPSGDALRGFFPVYRLSRRAVQCHHEQCTRGARGHMEALLPSVVERAGLRIEDFGGEGEFVAPGNENRFYRNDRFSSRLSPGTFVYRPAMTAAGSEPDRLWHPVKPPQRALHTALQRMMTRAATAVRR